MIFGERPRWVQPVVDLMTICGGSVALVMLVLIWDGVRDQTRFWVRLVEEQRALNARQDSIRTARANSALAARDTVK